ncbi:Protein kinase family protein [Euphorbia peplus]|nr:Protein kinase family protein [Euphorbia peplus]
MELSIFPCNQQNPYLIHKPLLSISYSTRRKSSTTSNSSMIPCRCSLSSSSDETFSVPLVIDGRRTLLASLLTTAAAIHVCDVAEAASTSRRALRASKIPDSEFTTLPNGLKYYDLMVGSGTKAEKGSRVAVHYVAKWKGITFMTSRQGLGVGGGTPYGFDVGQSERGNVLKGLDLGVEGMRVGGQRLIIVPPELAYGSKGVQEIPPNATIELDVELLSIKQSPFGSPVKIIEAVLMCSFKMITADPPFVLCYICFFLFFVHSCRPQKTCPSCGSIEVPYPLSTNSNCGDRSYHLRCDNESQKLYMDTKNGSSYLVLRIMPYFQRMVVQPSPWVSGSCVTRDMLVSEGFWLNQTLPFNVTSSNTIFLFNCSPRLFVSPLNCTPSSLCHSYLESSGRVEMNRSRKCASSLDPCCTFIAGGMPSAYKIRLHSSGCTAFRSVLNLDPGKPASQWEEGLEIQWTPPSEPVCKMQQDCSGASKCSPAENSLFRCLCNRDYIWDHIRGSCKRKKLKMTSSLSFKVSMGIVSFFLLVAAVSVIITRKSSARANQAKLAKAREDMLKSSNGGKTARMFGLKEVKKATNSFSKDRVLGTGGFGEVYKGELRDGTVVSVKLAKVGNIKSTQQVLNEVGILAQVNHKNLVRLLGCCVEGEQPLMIYEYITNGTLHDHLHGKSSVFLDWRKRLRVALQTAEALAYLHSGVHTPIYHRDVKSTNILLDDDFNAKVADFGLSRLARPGLSHVSTCAQGTLGYLDPEYYRNYQLTDKSDVYSYGVVLLELLTSQNAIDFSRDQDDVNLAIYVSQRAKNGVIMEVIDQRLLDKDFPDNISTSINLFSELALACLRERKADRPTMKEVVQQLECIVQTVEQQHEVNHFNMYN